MAKITISKEKYTRLAAMTLYIILVLCTAFPAANSLSSYNNGAILYVYGLSTENLTSINQSISNASLLQDLGSKEWLLKVPLIVNDSQATLKITGEDVSWLKLQSNNDTNIAYLKIQGKGVINNTKITSWNTTLNSPVIFGNYTNRSYIHFKNSPSAVIIHNSNLSHIGYILDNSFPSYNSKLYSGVSIENSQADIINSTFSYNANGIYLVSSANSTVSNTSVDHAAKYGIYTNAANNFTFDNVNVSYSYDNGFFIWVTNNSLIMNSISAYNGFWSYDGLGEDSISQGFNIAGGLTGVYNLTIKDCIAYGSTADQFQAGFYIVDTYYSTFSNLIAYNNSLGIDISSYASRNTIKDSLLYNNILVGLHIFGAANNNYFDNITAYNNNGKGFLIGEWSNNSIINNSHAYNNSIGGFLITTLTKDNTLVNIDAYNHSSYGISFTANATNTTIVGSRVYSNYYGINSNADAASVNYVNDSNSTGNLIDIRVLSGQLILDHILFGISNIYPINISACVALNVEGITYALNQSLNSSGVCFTIDADDITLDGQGHTVNYSQSTAGYAVSVNSRQNVTIKNLNIVQGNSSISNSYAIYANGMANSSVSNNTIRTFGTNAFGMYIKSGSDSNNISDNTVTAFASNNGLPIFILSSGSNTISGGSLFSVSSFDYYLQSAGATNYFRNTNFTSKRKIYFSDNASYFNYNNETSGNIWLKTNIYNSTGAFSETYIYRELVNWNRTLIKWNDTNATRGIISNYTLTGLLKGTTYRVYNTSFGMQENTFNLTTDSSGNIQSFSIALNGNTEIRLEGERGCIASLSNNIIYVYGAYISNLTCIYNAIQNSSVLEDLGRKEWLLKVPLIVNDSQATLKITGDDVSWLKMQSNNDTNIAYLKIQGKGVINNTKITSWNTANGAVAPIIDAYRSYILANGSNAELNIANSNISYLGYSSSNSYGVGYSYIVKPNVIENSAFTNNSAGIYLKNSANIAIRNNTVEYSAAHGIYLDSNSNNNILEQNRIYSHRSRNTYGTIIYAAYNNTVRNNTFFDNYYSVYLSAGASGKTSDNNIISYNSIIGSRASIIGAGLADGKANRNIIANNSFSNMDIGLSVGSNNSIEQNSITNTTNNYDNWDAGIMVSGSNILLQNNNISFYGTEGILVFSSSNITILGNYFDGIERPNKMSVYATDAGEINSAIAVLQEYKGGQNPIKNASSGIIIYNNTFGSNNQVYLYTQGARNISQYNFPEHWRRTFAFPDTGIGDFEIYANPAFGELLQRDSRPLFSFAVESGLVSYHYAAIDGNTEPELAYRVSKARLSFANANNKPREIILSSQFAQILFNETAKATSKIYPNGTSLTMLDKDAYSNPPYMIARPKFQNFLANATWYSTVNFTAMPSSNYLNITVLNWSASGNYYKKWNESAPSDSVSAHHIMGDFSGNALIAVKKSGAYWNVLVSNSSGYVGFNYSNSYPEIQFEAYEAPLAYLNIASYFYNNGSASFSESINGKTKAEITAFPEFGNVSLLVSAHNALVNSGNTAVNFSADTSSGNNAAFAISGLKQSANYRIRKDGNVFADLKSDALGLIVFNNSDW